MMRFKLRRKKAADNQIDDSNSARTNDSNPTGINDPNPARIGDSIPTSKMGLLERNLKMADRVSDPFPSSDSTKKKRTIGLVAIVVHSALIYISFATIFMEYQASRDDKSGGYDDANLLIQPQENTTETSLKSSFAYRESKSSGSLSIIDKNGKELFCPLKHTKASAKISGYIAKVTVTQLFNNPLKDRNVEAFYTFPLDEPAAVDSMIIKHGDHIVSGVIKTKEEAARIYSDAKARGKTAALLDELRPNIFTQSIANIEPGKQVEVQITYVTTLPFEAGKFTFTFPTVVGPRFIPPKYKDRMGLSADGTHSSYPEINANGEIVYSESKDAQLDRIVPPVAAQLQRAGHDIEIDVSIDSGCPIKNLISKLHEINVQQSDSGHAMISLKNTRSILNKDFVLSWEVSGKAIASSYLNHKNKNEDGYLTVMMMPPNAVSRSQIAPRELVFLIDCSGSQSGDPLVKSKETIRYIVERMNQNDTFQIVAFSDFRTKLFDKPVSANLETKRKAFAFLDGLTADGGTVMLDAVKDVCAMPAEKHRLRIVTLMTDGYIGNDREVISAVHQMRGTSRWFMFGTGDSPNRFLCESVASIAGGESDYVLLNSPTKEVAERFYRKVSFPVLSDVKVSFNGLPVRDVLPKSPATDVWANRPLYLNARYTKEAKGTVTLTGFAGGLPYKQSMNIDLTKNSSDGNGLGSIWARRKVEELAFDETLKSGSPDGSRKDEIVALGLRHHILTPYTSFVAVDELRNASKNAIQKMLVPVEIPEGMVGAHRGGAKAASANSSVANPANTVASSAAANTTGDALRQFVQGKSLRMEGLTNAHPGAANSYMGLAGAPVDPRFGQSNEVGQLADYGYNETYTALHTFWGDDVISNFFANMGQLIGKWLTEFINGWVSDTTQFLVGLLRSMTLNNSVLDALDETNPAVANLVRRSADAIRIFGWIVMALLCYRTFREKQRVAMLEVMGGAHAMNGVDEAPDMNGVPCINEAADMNGVPDVNGVADVSGIYSPSDLSEMRGTSEPLVVPCRENQVTESHDQGSQVPEE